MSDSVCPSIYGYNSHPHSPISFESGTQLSKDLWICKYMRAKVFTTKGAHDKGHTGYICALKSSSKFGWCWSPGHCTMELALLPGSLPPFCLHPHDPLYVKIMFKRPDHVGVNKRGESGNEVTMECMSHSGWLNIILHIMGHAHVIKREGESLEMRLLWNAYLTLYYIS